MESNYKFISAEAYKISGEYMNAGEFMDAEKRKIVFTTLNTMFIEHKLISKWCQSDEFLRSEIENIIMEATIKTLSKNANYHTGHGYWLWRKSKMTRYGNLEEFIKHIFSVVISNEDLVNRIINK